MSGGKTKKDRMREGADGRKDRMKAGKTKRTEV
jgi:hypothetical protein